MENEEFDLMGEYGKLREKYGLPEFELLARDFDIEKVLEKESSFIIREIRRAINEKLSAYLHLFETLINPSAPPMFVFSVLRGLNPEDKEKIKKLYKRLSKFQINVMRLDTIYDEKNEAEFVKDAFKEWQELKVEIYSLVGNLEKGFEENNYSKESGYFG